MKKIYIIIILSIMIVLWLGTAAYPDPMVGLYKLTIKEGWNLVSLPLQTLQLSQGKITTLGSNTISDSSKSWTENNYQNDVLLICSGSAEGYYYQISSNTTDTLTLSVSLSTSIAVGDRFYIYQAYTITEIFGDDNGSLHAAAIQNDADEIYLWNRNSQSLSASIWLCNKSGQEGWWQGETQITDNSVTLLPNEACFVVHKTSTEVTINYLGVVPDTKQTINIKAGETLAGQSYPLATTIGNSGLDSILQSGTSSYPADNIYFWDIDEQKFKLPVWHSSASGYENWYQGTENVNTTNFNPGEGFLLKNRACENNWQREKPYD